MDMDENNISIPGVVELMTAHNSNMLQFHLFEDKEKTRPNFAAFFIIGDHGEPEEAIDQMGELRLKWIESRNSPKIDVNGNMEVSYVIQQIDTEGECDITRKCDSIESLVRAAKQKGIDKILDNQRVVKRINIPLNISLEDE